KMVMALRHGVLPRTLHVDAPSSHVDWSVGAVELLTEERAWPEVGRPRRAGVSSFGISGTNAHVIVEQAPDRAEPAVSGAVPSLSPTPWPISAKDAVALREQASRLAAHPVASATDVGRSLAVTRAALEHRAVLVGGSVEELLGKAAEFGAGAGGPTAVEGRTLTNARTVFVFPGQGSQWVGMGVDLLESSPVFASRMEECAAALEPYVDWSLVEALVDPVLLERVDVVQPVLWAVM
ncbi:acyltransferase domain-containing protein, partial [Streptomyces sp. ME19-01-6]|uniref:acyltransferase domain-containing protein n=1 Tax=Streptomyces sp. ME19-01-6 TaxID=3028686 RepID=UPI0029A9F690